MTNNKELNTALRLAAQATPDSLFTLSNMASHIRNSKEVFEQLGLATGDNIPHVIEHITREIMHGEEAAINAVHALSSLNTHEAEERIVTLASTVLRHPKHPEHDYIGAEAIAALEKMETVTAADRILELGQKYDTLVHPALTSLGNLYDRNHDVFKSSYRLMLDYITDPEVMDKVVSGACDQDDVAILSDTFKRADERAIYKAVPSDSESIGFCSCAFKLALSKRELEHDLRKIGDERAELFATRQLAFK